MKSSNFESGEFSIRQVNNFLEKYGAFYEAIDEDSEYAKKRFDALVKDKIIHVGFRKNTYSLTSGLFFDAKIYYETNKESYEEIESTLNKITLPKEKTC